MMEIEFERTGNVALFTLAGRIDSAGSAQMDTAIKSWMAPTDLSVLFDMARVSYMSSAGIRVFSMVERGLRQKNGHLFLCAVQPAVEKVLEITGFHRIFTLCATTGEALHRSDGTQVPGGKEDAALFGTGDVRLSVEVLVQGDAVLKISGAGEHACTGVFDASDLVSHTFVRDEYCAGVGAPGDSPEEAFLQLGGFVTMGGVIFWRPFGSTDAPDFLIPDHESPGVCLQTAFSVALDGDIHEVIVAEPHNPAGVSLAGLFSQIFSRARKTRAEPPGITSVVLYATLTPDAGSRLQLKSNRVSGTVGSDNTGNVDDAGSIGGADPHAPGTAGELSMPATGKVVCAFGCCIDPEADLSCFDREALDAILCEDMPARAPGDLVVNLSGLIFNAESKDPTQGLFRLIAETAKTETCTGLVRLAASVTVSRAVIGISYVSGIVQTDRVPIRIAGECPGWNATFERLARQLNPGCGLLELVPLTGGFSGTCVFRVNAWDRRGRKMMPLVMKLGNQQIIDAEIRGYTDHVKRYIQNNATQILEQAQIGGSGGILYNFVGIRGTESRILSLSDFYLSHTTDEIQPVIDTLFRVVLRGWYGQPRLKEMHLYEEYNQFWKYDQILSYAASHFGATPGDETCELPFGLGTSTNPLWFVETVLPRRLTDTALVYEASVHGDLNMKNVLMDETNNLWLIDFAETRYSHCLRDIVKLEAVIKGEQVPIRTRETLKELVLLDARFLAPRSFSCIPEIPDGIIDPALDKAFRCVQQLRRYADLVTLLDDDISQYYIGLLPFTLNLLSYSSVNDRAKEYGWISSSMICKRLMEMGR